MNIFVLNTLAIGNNLILSLLQEIKISGVIGLSHRHSVNNEISDFSFQKILCDEHNLRFIEVESYSLTNLKDKKIISELSIDILIISGWQRLIPGWLIDNCNIAAIGSHGSPFGITKGRGRSPQNWSLILGLKEFHISIFKVDKNIDSGPVIDTKRFEISQFDTIKTTHYKVSLLMSEMLITSLKTCDFLSNTFQDQDESEAEYFPKRQPNDGQIDWNKSNEKIRNFTRALTKPYPGAFSFLSGHKITIWNVIPVNIDLQKTAENGTIVKIFNKTDVLVKTTANYILIDDYEIESHLFTPLEGMRFENESFETGIENIIRRHEKSYPSLRISKSLKALI